jgi:RluA family pseudouridine synthase
MIQEQKTVPASDSAASVEPTYLNIAAYKFVPLEDLHERRKVLRRLTTDLKLCGTILLSPEGINLFIAGEQESIDHFLETLRSDACFADLTVKESWTTYQPFRRMLVKIKREIIAFGIESVRPEVRTSPKLTPEQLKAWLDEGRELTLLDTRNDYEIELGTFDRAVDLHIHHFRDFPEAAEALPAETKEKPLVMFCTGGIRCEKAGPYLEQVGFKNVYQLDGGILNYFERCGGAHYDGDCFVFDHRVAVKPDLQPSGAKLCFVCQAALTAEDIASEKYQVSVSCPSCFTSKEEQQKEILFRRRKAIAKLAENPPGSTPYENRRPMFVARQYAGYTLIDWLVAMHQGLDRDFWMQAIEANAIVTGPHYSTAATPVQADSIVREGQTLVHVQPGYVEPDVDGNIKVLYEDTWMVAVDKPAPLPSHASGQYCRNTLEYILGQVYRPEKLLLAHRLDSLTSGVVVLSRRYAVAAKLQRQFADNTVQKIYVARVQGHPIETEFRSEAKIGREPTAAGGRSIDESGDEAITEFRVRQRLPDNTSILEIYPRTGRTHQIRLHLSTLGFPIVGDPLYGASFQATQPLTPRAPLPEDEERGRKNSLSKESVMTGIASGVTQSSLPAMCLHAWKLSMIHPVHRDRIEFEAPLPGWAVYSE